MIGFSQDKNLKESKLNFNKSNNYGSINKESNSVESYTHPSVQNSKDSIQKKIIRHPISLKILKIIVPIFALITG